MSHMTLGTCCSTLGNRRRCHVGHDDQRWARRWALDSLRSGRWAPDEDVTLGTTTNVGHDVGHSIFYVRHVGLAKVLSKTKKSVSLSTLRGSLKLSRARVYIEFTHNSNLMVLGLSLAFLDEFSVDAQIRFLKAGES